MDQRPVVWELANRDHLIRDHPERRLTQNEIEEVLTDDRRLEIHQPERNAYLVIGRTRSGRWLVVAWVDDPGGRYPIHARPAGRRTIRRLNK